MQSAKLELPEINPQKGGGNPRLRALAVVGFILLGLAIYSNTLKSPFQFDDRIFIVDNPRIHDLRDLGAMWNVWPARITGTLTFALNYYFHQEHVAGYHLVNLFFHVLTSFAVAWLAHLTFLTPRLAATVPARSRDLLAWGAGLLFLTHPLATTTVNHITQRYTLLVAFFYVSALCFYIRGRLSSQLIYFFGALLLGILGFYTKQTAITLPVMIVLYEWLFFHSAEKRKWGRWAVAGAALIAGLFFVFLHRHSIFSQFAAVLSSQSHDGDRITWSNYFLTQPRVILTYVRLLFSPWPLNFDYDFKVSENFFEPVTFLSFSVIFLILFLGVALRRRQPLFAFGIFWFFIAQGVESSFLPISYVITEYRTYLPSAGLFILLVSSLSVVLKREKNFFLFIAALAVMYAALSYSRNQVWQDEITFWQDAVTKSPHKARPHNNLGAEYLERRRFKEAFQEFQMAIFLNPTFAEPYCNVSKYYYLKVPPDMDRALLWAERALRIGPLNPFCLHQAGYLYAQGGQFDAAFKCYSVLLSVTPTLRHATDLGKLVVLYFLKTKDQKQAFRCLAVLSERGFPDLADNFRKIILEKSEWSPTDSPRAMRGRSVVP